MRRLDPKFVAFAILGLVIVESSLAKNFRNLDDVFKDNEDAHLTTRQLIAKYRYQGETHFVTTEDEYLLEMHRIIGPNGTFSAEGKQPILMVHGLLSSSTDWIITGPGRAFAYILADEGYDVWMGNVRGNTYSRQHKKWSIHHKEYWQFSWHEIGCNDLPAMIDYILAKTNRKKILYTGHSQGTTTFFVMASERPEYQDKITAMFALAPVAYLTHNQSPFYQVLSKFGNNIEAMMTALGRYEFEPTNELVTEIMQLACDEEAWTQPVCMNVIFLIAGFGSDQLNKTMLPSILGHVPAGASVKQVAHYGQLINIPFFRQYDHGWLKNLKKYGRLHPPDYDLTKIKVPVSLHYSTNDLFTSPIDVNRLHKALKNPIGKFRVPHEKFTHLDFIWAKDGNRLLYNKIVGLLQKYRD